MKLYRVTTTTPDHVKGSVTGAFTDWYEGETWQAAKADYDEDLHRYGLPADCKCEVVECDPVTLKPLVPQV